MPDPRHLAWRVKKTERRGAAEPLALTARASHGRSTDRPRAVPRAAIFFTCRTSRQGSLRVSQNCARDFIRRQRAGRDGIRRRTIGFAPCPKHLATRPFATARISASMPRSPRWPTRQAHDETPMARCERGYLCDVCGEEVAEIADSDLYLSFILGLVEARALLSHPERHIRCNPAQAQFIVDERFEPVVAEGAFDKRRLDTAYVRE